MQSNENQATIIESQSPQLENQATALGNQGAQLEIQTTALGSQGPQLGDQAPPLGSQTPPLESQQTDDLNDEELIIAPNNATIKPTTTKSKSSRLTKKN